MAKYCNNTDCEAYKKYQEGRHCYMCGEPLIDDTHIGLSTSKAVKGDGISVSRVMNDSHDTISNKNTTIVINGKSLDDLSLKERKATYRRFCSEHIRNGIITPAIRRELDEYALELELNPETRKEIESYIRKNASETYNELTALDYDNLSIIKTSVANNKVKINDALPKLEAMSASDYDEILFYYNLLLVCSSPASIIKKYCEQEQDIYWRTFWANLAYLKNGQRVKAEQLLRELAVWETQAQDNLYVLQAAGAILNDDAEAAETFYSKAKNCSYLLESLSKTIAFILKTKGIHKLSNSSDVNFYLENLFGFKEEQPVEVAVSYRAPIPQPLRDRVDGKVGPKPAVASSSTANVNNNGGSGPSGKYIGLSAIVVAIVAILLSLPKGQKDSKDGNIQSIPQAVQTEGQKSSGSEQKSPPAASAKPHESQKTTDMEAPAYTSSGDKPIVAPAGTSGSKTSSNVQKPLSGNSVSPTTPAAQNTSPISTQAQPKEDPITTLKRSAESGSKEAQFELGMRYYDGNGMPQNMSTAFQYLKPLAEAGYVKAYFPVAEMYHRGQGVAKDRNAAEKWYQKAADAGNAKAKNILLNSF
ncbi:MAG: sel1 repeat family protein [Bacteroidales bacterium]|nr:sel1 repeat family protein [Bacteroidales bacterium]